MTSGIPKSPRRGVTGDQYTIRNVIDFDRNTNVANTYQNGAFDSYVEGEIRHPLLQGAGVEYNRIAGPGAKPGVYNGVLVARIRSDISTADFELGLRDYVSNVESAYWDLYFAYRDLDVKIQARDEALRTWRGVYALWAPLTAPPQAAKTTRRRRPANSISASSKTWRTRWPAVPWKAPARTTAANPARSAQRPACSSPSGGFAS